MNKQLLITIISVLSIPLQGMFSEGFISHIMHYDCSKLQLDADRSTTDELTQRLTALEKKEHDLVATMNALKVVLCISAIKLFEEPKILEKIVYSRYTDLASACAVCTGYYFYSRYETIDTVKRCLLEQINRQRNNQLPPPYAWLNMRKRLKHLEEKIQRQN